MFFRTSVRVIISAKVFETGRLSTPPQACQRACDLLEAGLKGISKFLNGEAVSTPELGRFNLILG
jgi:hypothetical protein